jgi:hypothetical protein
VLQKVASLWTRIALLSLLTTPLQLLLLQAMLLAGANLMRKLKISNLLVSLLWIHHSLPNRRLLMTRKQQSIATVLTLMVVYLLTLAKLHLMLLIKSMLLEAQMPKHLFNQTKKVLLMVNNLRRRKLMRLKMETKMLKAYQAEPPRIVLS